MEKKIGKLSIRVLLNTHRRNDCEIYPLIIRVVYHRRKSEYSLGWKIHTSNFSADRERVVYSSTGNLKRKDLGLINDAISQERERLLKIFAFLQQNMPGFSLSQLMDKYRMERNLRYVDAFIVREIERLRQEGRSGTAGLYLSGLYSLRRFLRGQKITFRELTYCFLTDYIHFLRMRGISENTVNMYIRNLWAVYNKAQKQGINMGCESPFRELKLQTQETAKRALCKHDIARIVSVDLSSEPLLDRARDLFMFSFYARGMPFVDIVFLKHDSIINGIIYYERNKTGQRMQVRVIPPLAALIEKYRSSYPYVLPYITSFSDRTSYMQYRYALGNVNRLLKRLGRRLHLPLVLTTYVARHSWATIAKEEGFSIASISEGLGHTSEATTQIYLQSFNSEVIDKINEQVVASIGRHI